MTEREEQIYQQGQRQLADRLLASLRHYLPEIARDKQSLVSERAAAIASLRELCAEYGDNDWPDASWGYNREALSEASAR